MTNSTDELTQQQIDECTFSEALANSIVGVRLVQRHECDDFDSEGTVSSGLMRHRRLRIPSCFLHVVKWDKRDETTTETLGYVLRGRGRWLATHRQSPPGAMVVPTVELPLTS